MIKLTINMLAVIITLSMVVSCGGGGSSNGFSSSNTNDGTNSSGTNTTGTNNTETLICEGSSASPVSITVGVSHHGTICATSFSMYSFATTTNAGTYQVNFTNATTSSVLGIFVSDSQTSSGVGVTCTSNQADTEMKCTAGPLLASMTYYLRVNAGGVKGEYDLTVVDPTKTIPSAPKGVQAVAGSGAINITWTSVSQATSYNVYRSTSEGITVDGASVTKFTNVAFSFYFDSSVTADTKYYYAVTAVNSNGESDLSSEVTATAK